MQSAKLKRISEFTGEKWLNFPWRKVGEIIGTDIVIVDFVRREGRLGEYVLIKCKGPDAKEFIVRTGAKAVIGDLEKVQGQLPLVGRFEERVGASGRTYLVLV